MMTNMDKLQSQIRQKSRLNGSFIALRHQNFRVYLISMSISLIGTWMQNIAQPWLAYTLTRSPLLLSLVSVMQNVPMLVFSLFAGVIIDHYPRKRILLFTQTASALITLMLALLVWSGRIQYWHILVLATALGTVNSLDIPARQSFAIELVGKEDLMNAVALNSTVFNTARIVGPALAGLAMGYLGIAFCFFLNSISFSAVIICLLFIKPQHVTVIQKTTNKITSDIKNGIVYIFQSKTLLDTLVSTAIVTTFAMNFSVLIPVFTSKILNQQETGFGFLMSFMGIGSLTGALLVTMKSRTGPNRFVYNVMPIATAVLLFVTSFSHQYLLTAVILAFTGFSIVSFTSTTNSIMQINTDNEFRGRVMSIYNLVFCGTMLMGNLFTGYIADHYGADVGFAACGVLMALLLILAALFKAAKKQSSIN
jgi:MFS family permease